MELLSEHFAEFIEFSDIPSVKYRGFHCSLSLKINFCFMKNKFYKFRKSKILTF